MSIDLVPEWTVGDLCLTSYPFGVDADSTVDVGEPEMVVESVTSMLADGDIERHVRDGNRTYVLELYVEGPSLAEIATSEALLRTTLRRTGLTLTHDPGDGFSPVSVYEVQTAQLTPQRNDTHESHLIRKFTLTLRCSPFARSAELTTASAMAAPGTVTTVTVDTCDSVTGWTGKRNGAPSPADGPSTIWEAGAVGIMELSNTVGYPPETWTLIRTGSIDFSTTPYLLLEVTTLTAKAGGPLQLSVSVSTGSGPGATTVLPVVASTKIADGSGYYRILFNATGVGTASTLTIEHTSSSGYGHAWQGLSVRNVARTNDISVVSARQLSRIIEVGGTERTPASLHAFTTSGYLGHTILHTTPYMGAGYTPDMQRWRVSGNGTSANVSTRKITGTWEALQPNPVVSNVPSDQLPRGDYILVAAIKSNLTGERAISWAVKSLLVGTVLGNTTGTAYYNFTVADRLEYVPLGVVSAPTTRSSGVLDTEIHLSNPSGAVALHVEEWWMFTDGPESALSIVGSDEAELWIESADTSSPVPQVRTGNSVSGWFHPGGRMLAQGDHTFKPGLMQVNTISDANDYLEVDLTYYKRWHSNAAE